MKEQKNDESGDSVRCRHCAFSYAETSVSVGYVEGAGCLCTKCEKVFIKNLVKASNDSIGSGNYYKAHYGVCGKHTGFNSGGLWAYHNVYFFEFLSDAIRLAKTMHSADVWACQQAVVINPLGRKKTRLESVEVLVTV